MLVLFDSDVLLDVLAERQQFVQSSAQALDYALRGKVRGYVSGHAVTNIFYILRCQVGSELARELLSKLLTRLQVASVTDEVIRSALISPIKDFEDAVASMAANIANLDIIVTRNIADFVNSPVPAMLPEDFTSQISE
jgi:predicted nucleic-acid-binding protein